MAIVFRESLSLSPHFEADNQSYNASAGHLMPLSPLGPPDGQDVPQPLPPPEPLAHHTPRPLAISVTTRHTLKKFIGKSRELGIRKVCFLKILT